MFDAIERKNLLILKYIIEGDEAITDLIQAEYDYISAMMQPKIYDYDVRDNIIDQVDKSFIKLCTSLEANGIPNPKQLSYYEFNLKIDYFEDIKRNSNEIEE